MTPEKLIDLVVQSTTGDYCLDVVMEDNPDEITALVTIATDDGEYKARVTLTAEVVKL